MFPAANEMPTPIGSIDDLIDTGDTSEKPYKTFIGHNLGSRTFLMIVPMRELFEISEVANDRGRDGESIAQRKLDIKHAEGLAKYLLKGLVSSAIKRKEINKQPISEDYSRISDSLGRQPYMSMQPIVANLRECAPGGANIRGVRMQSGDETACFKIFLSQKHTLWIVDGQHRRMGMKLVFDFLEHVRTTQSYPKKGSLFLGSMEAIGSSELQVWQECYEVARSFCTIAVEIHLGLSPDEERQLFHDLNNLSKKVEKSLALQFDSSNPVNLFIKDRLINGLGIQVAEKDVSDWNSDHGEITRKDLVAVNAILFLNKTNISGATPLGVADKFDTCYRFWEAVTAIPGFGEEGARSKTVAAQPVVLKALAKLTFDYAFNSRKGRNADVYLEKIFDGISDVDFSHENPMWRYYEMTPEDVQRAGLAGLVEYLPKSDTGANRDVGSFQNGLMRFGAKHNDIYPIIADMLRWRLGLSSRSFDTSTLLDIIK